MVLAGPGSGKTSVIVERTAYMINEGKIPASSILVVTFSRAAATEMKERFLKFVGQNRSEVTFGTFHGIFYGILKAAYHLSAANILSEEEKFSILREMTEKYGQEMAQEGDFIEEVAREISVVKGNCISPEHYYASCCSDEIFRDIFHGYKQALKAKRKLDFDDMILCCYELFSQRQDILNAWRRKFVYILGGGVALGNISAKTLECKSHEGLYFAGEVLDVDAVTGGFNLQAAWTMGYVAAKSVAEKYGTL